MSPVHSAYDPGVNTVLDDLWGGYQEGLTFDSTTRTLDLKVSDWCLPTGPH
jgi:hypothetical protein